MSRPGSARPSASSHLERLEGVLYPRVVEHDALAEAVDGRLHHDIPFYVAHGAGGVAVAVVGVDQTAALGQRFLVVADDVEQRCDVPSRPRGRGRAAVPQRLLGRPDDVVEDVEVLGQAPDLGTEGRILFA